MNMKEIIPFKKEIIFDKNINEITSISLENTLSIKNNDLCGDFIISGEYKSEENIIPFSKKIPFNIVVDDVYDTRNATVDIDDFYYEVKNNNTLFVSIDVLLDKLERVELEDVREIIEEKKENYEEPSEKRNEDISLNIFNDSNFKTESYVEYNVYILREGDTIDTIIDKYNTTVDKLKEYNNLDDLKMGDKIIIPSNEGD